MQSIRNKYPRWSPAQWQGAYWAHTRPWVQSLVTTSLSTHNVQHAVPSQGGRAPVSFAGSSGQLQENPPHQPLLPPCTGTTDLG